MSEFPRYKRCEEVLAFKIGEIICDHDAIPCRAVLISSEDESVRIEVSGEWLSLNLPQVGGYWFASSDGYEGYLSSQAFEAFHSLITDSNEG